MYSKQDIYILICGCIWSSHYKKKKNMGILSDIDVYAKVFISVIGAIATFRKLSESFASIKRKQEIKIDLEILEKIKDKEDFDSKYIENKIREKLNKAFEPDFESLTTFFTGIAVFIGFGFWSVDIYRNSANFNGWIILTLSCSLIGLSMIFSRNEAKRKKDIFFQIGLYDKENFRFGVILTLLTGILTPILILKLDGFSFWQFLSGLFFIIGIASIFSNIKQIK